MEMASISTDLAEDQVCVQRHIEEMQAPLASFLATVKTLHERFSLLDEQKPLSEQTKAKILANLDEIKAQCQSTPDRPILQPYRTYADEVAGHVDCTKQFLVADEREKAKAEFMNAYIVARIQDLYIRFQEFYEGYLANGKSVDLDQMLLDLEELNARAISKDVAPEVMTDRYSHFWGSGIYHLINGLRVEILAARDQEDPKKRSPFLVKMRERFRKVDFKGIVDRSVSAA